MTKIAVLASGAGTTFEHLCKQTHLFEVSHLVCNREAPVNQIAKKLGVPAIRIPSYSKEFLPLGDWSQLIFSRLFNPDLIVLAGFDQMIHVSKSWENKILNIHPSLLPEFGGKGMYGLRVHEAVLEAGQETTGCTVHIVDNEYDHGTILAQRIVPVYQTDTPKTLQSRVQEAERDLYPKAIFDYLKKLND